MKVGLKARGFTIIETLIVLAISGSMLVAVVAMISGQQGKTQFQQSINQVSQQIQQIIGDVSNGYYPVSNIACSATGSSVNIIKLTGSSIGTNSECVLVGKVIQFNQNPDPQQFIVYSMVGSRSNNNGAYPIAIAPGANTYTNVPLGNTTITSLANGISLAYITYTDSTGFVSANSSVAFGILTSHISGSGATDISGAQQINIYAINGTSATNDSTVNVDSIDKSNPTNFVSITSFGICLVSGTTNQSGLITIGGGSRKLSVVLAIKDGKKC